MLKLYRGDVSELQFWTFGLPQPRGTMRLTAARGSRLFLLRGRRDVRRLRDTPGRLQRTRPAALRSSPS